MTVKDALAEVLADRRWHTALELFRAARPYANPGKAYRRYLLEHGEPKDMDQAVRWGQWRMIQYYLANCKYFGSIEGRGTGSRREYRLIGERVTTSRKGANGKATGKT